MAALDGLESLEQVGTLALVGRTIRDLSPLSGLRDVEGLQVSETGLVDLAGLESARLRSFVIQNNPELESLRGLTVSDVVDSAQILDNPVLRDVTSLGPLREVWYLELARNPALAELRSFPSSSSGRRFSWHTTPRSGSCPSFHRSPRSTR